VIVAVFDSEIPSEEELVHVKMRGVSVEYVLVLYVLVSVTVYVSVIVYEGLREYECVSDGVGESVLEKSVIVGRRVSESVGCDEKLSVLE
jgi:hypothetical protein